MPFQRGECSRALQRQQRAIIEVVERDLIGQMFAQMGQIVPFGRAVDHHIDRLWPARHHQIIKYAAVLIEQQRIAYLAEFKRREVNRQNGLNRRINCIAGDQQLPHVADIKQPGMLPRPQVFGHHAFILNRHVIAGEFDHPPAAHAMPAIERQGHHLSHFLVGQIPINFACINAHQAQLRTVSTPFQVPPLSRKPESITPSAAPACAGTLSRASLLTGTVLGA